MTSLLFVLCALPGMIISFIAQGMLKTRIKSNSVPSQRQMTGAEVAQYMLQANGITNVRVERIAGELTDHYSPKEKIVRLSDLVYDKRTITAMGVAAHEVGHAIQDAKRYGPLVLRQTVAPAAIGAQKVSMFLVSASFVVTGMVHQAQFVSQWVLLGAACLFSVAVLFSLVTLPVEFDASKRALKQLGDLQISWGDEWKSAKGVLNAAALTYVAASAAMIGQFIIMFLRAKATGRR